MHGLDSESPDVEMQGSFYAMDIIEPNRLKIEINVDAMLEYWCFISLIFHTSTNINKQKSLPNLKIIKIRA